MVLKARYFSILKLVMTAGLNFLFWIHQKISSSRRFPWEIATRTQTQWSSSADKKRRAISPTDRFLRRCIIQYSRPNRKWVLRWNVSVYASSSSFTCFMCRFLLLCLSRFDTRRRNTRKDSVNTFNFAFWVGCTGGRAKKIIGPY